MAYFACPHCGEEMIRIHLTEYEPDTNGGGVPEITSVDCGCDLTVEEQEEVYAEADKCSWFDEE